MPKGMAHSLIDYCELVVCTGRCIREDKAGYIEQHHSTILERLNLDTEQWLTLTTEFEKHFSTAVGSEHMLQQFKHHTNHQRIRGMAKARALLQHAWTVQHHTRSKLASQTCAQWRCLKFKWEELFSCFQHVTFPKAQISKFYTKELEHTHHFMLFDLAVIEYFITLGI
jgi:hypothetical protein